MFRSWCLGESGMGLRGELYRCLTSTPTLRYRVRINFEFTNVKLFSENF